MGTAAGRLADAHRTTVQSGIDEVTRFLEETLGRALLAYITDVDQRTVGRWSAGQARPRAAAESRLRNTYYVFKLLQAGDSAHTVRAWFIGMNPQLEDLSPAEALRAGKEKRVAVAARSFIQGG